MIPSAATPTEEAAKVAVATEAVIAAEIVAEEEVAEAVYICSRRSRSKVFRWIS